MNANFRTLPAIALTAAIGLAGTANATYNVVALTDAQANDLLIDKTFAAEGRFGNNQLNGTFELGLQQPNGTSYFTTEQGVWTNNTTHAFSLQYTAATGDVTFTALGEQLQWNFAGSTFTDFYLRQRATATSTMHLQDVQLNGVDVVGIAGTTNGAVNYWLSKDEVGFDLSQTDWTLTGNALLAWDVNSLPLNSALAFQIKTVEAVPEPATMLALASGIGLLVARRRKLNS